MVIDPFEKEFHLPAAAVQFGDGERGQDEIVGQEYQGLGCFGILKADAALRGLEVLVRVEAREDDTLVADQAGLAIARTRVAALHLEVRLTAGHEEAAGLVKTMETLEVKEATIHDVNRPGLGQQLIKDVDLVHFAIADVDEGGNVAAQIQQRVQFDVCLGRAERRPWKYRQAQIDRRGVERVDSNLQIDTKGLLCLQMSNDAHQALSESGLK